MSLQGGLSKIPYPIGYTTLTDRTIQSTTFIASPKGEAISDWAQGECRTFLIVQALELAPLELLIR